MDGLGEKLKTLSPAILPAFKMSGMVTKSGQELPAKAQFKISREEAMSALAKYEKGLKELKYI